MFFKGSGTLYAFGGYHVAYFDDAFDVLDAEVG
jgi:hypothetical protein